MDPGLLWFTPPSFEDLEEFSLDFCLLPYHTLTLIYFNFTSLNNGVDEDNITTESFG